MGRGGLILILESIIITSQVGPVTVWANILPLFLFVKEIKLRKPTKQTSTLNCPQLYLSSWSKNKFFLRQQVREEACGDRTSNQRLQPVLDTLTYPFAWSLGFISAAAALGGHGFKVGGYRASCELQRAGTKCVNDACPKLAQGLAHNRCSISI